MNGQEHFSLAERLLEKSDGVNPEHATDLRAAAQVHATLAQAAATEALGQAIQSLPNYEGMLAVYNFGGSK